MNGTEMDAASESSSDSEHDSSSVSMIGSLREGGGRRTGGGRDRHSWRGISHSSPRIAGFVTSAGFLDPSHDIHDALLEERRRPSSSRGVRKLFDPLDDAELDDVAGALSSAVISSDLV